MNENSACSPISSVDTGSLDSVELIDISGVVVDSSLPASERIRKYIEDVGNPYLFLVNDTVVRLRFSDGSASLQSLLEGMYTNGV